MKEYKGEKTEGGHEEQNADSSYIALHRRVGGEVRTCAVFKNPGVQEAGG